MRRFTYILLCDQKMYYVGITSNPEKRVKQHQQKASLFTKQFSDIKLVYFEQLQNKNKAVSREKQLKGWSNAKKKALIENRKDVLLRLSRST